MSITAEEMLTCRACLTTFGNFVSIHCTLITKNTNLQISLNDCWNYCMRWRAENMADVVDMLPNYMCLKCSGELQSAYNFLKNANEALRTLRSQRVVNNYENGEINEMSVVGPNTEWEVVEQVLEKVIAENYDLLEDDVTKDFTEGQQIENSEYNEDWMLDIEKLIDCDEDVNATNKNLNAVNEDVDTADEDGNTADEDAYTADESCESPSVQLDELKEKNHTFALPNQRKFRVEEVEDKISITCIQCALVFRNYRRFEDHLYEHRSMQPYACSMCTQKLQNMKGLVQHYTKSHGIDPTLEQLQPKACDKNALGPADFEQRTMYLCIHCSFEHVDFKSIKQHIRDMHDSTDLKHIIKKLPYQCPKCLRCFTCRDKVVKHAEYEHSNIMYSTAVRIRKYDICNKCGKNAIYAKSAFEQLQKRLSVSIKILKKSGKLFSDRPGPGFCNCKKYELSQRKRHESRCDGEVKTYQCKICKGIYANRTMLMDHKREAHPLDPQADSPFRCEICGNTYRTRIQLRFHVKRHDARNFKCNQCNRTFIRPHDLSKHQLIHTGELPYKCDMCSSSYRYSHALRDHKERIHLNESFMCKVSGCGAQFRTRSQLNDHKYKHIGNPYRCEICSKDFLRRESLRRHSKAVHKICLTEDQLTKIYQQNMGRYNTHDIRKMSEIEACVN